jgi:hypothetical protein
MSLSVSGIPNDLLLHQGNWTLNLNFDFLSLSSFHFSAGDATVRLWDVPTEPLSTVKGNLTQTAILKQYKDGDNKTDVTCVSWNVRF